MSNLKRILGMWDLIVYGMILVQIIAPVPIYGLVQERSSGHALLTILLGMVAMMFTAVSYGRMTFLYPFAGSAYTYVARSIHPAAGFFIGWGMILDYLIIPLISIIIPALVLQRIVPEIPFPILTLLIVLAMTLLNLGGIRTAQRANTLLFIVTSAVVLLFLVLACRYLIQNSGISGLFSLKPVYDSATFRFDSVLSGTSLAVLTYIGFDGVTTLAEETINPQKTVVRATVLICLITGLVSSVEIYFFQMVWPDWSSFSHPDTAYLDIMKLVGGTLLFGIFSAIMCLSQFGSGLGGQTGAARLLYGMGRDGVLPEKVFGFLNEKSGNPTYNILIVGGIAFVGSLLFPLAQACDLLNFGAFLGYMGVNLAVIQAYYFHPPQGHRRKIASDLLLPLAGFLFCLLIWLSLPTTSKILGFGWLILGFIIIAFKTNGFRKKIVLFNFGDPDKT